MIFPWKLLKMMMNLQRMLPRCSSLIVYVVAINFLVPTCWCIRLTNMTAPAVQDPRRDMQLHCRFDMGGEELYAVKWYKDDHEFFRFCPGKKDQEFPVPGVYVEKQRSKCTRDRCDLLLTNLSRPLSSGAYRCEVSTEAPAFRLASQTHNVTVAALPDEYPSIGGLASSYEIGDIITATCTSGFGDPKPTLTWYINKQQVASKSVKEMPIKSPKDFALDERVKLKSAIHQLKLQLEKKLIQGDPSMEISCVSSVEGLNPSVAPALTSRKNVLIGNQNQLVNNQKLHWPDAATSIRISNVLVVLGAILTLLVKCF